MINCFLFLHDINEEGCLSLCLDEQGHVKASLKFRTFAEIKTLQINTKTTVICPSIRFSIHLLELPRLSENKLHAAIPFALEEKLPENVETLHFAFDKNHYLNGRYLVIMGDKIELKKILEIFISHNIKIDNLTLDWFALKEGESALINNYILSNNAHFKGAISLELAPLYFKNWHDETLFHFKDSKPFTLNDIALKEKHESTFMWLAKRLLKKKTINLCQGELQYGNAKETLNRWFKLSLAACGLWFLCFFLMNAFKLYHLHQEIKHEDSQIATIYHHFFPEAKLVISPKFRVNQLINSNQNQSNLVFWTLLEKLISQVKDKQLTLEQIRFQNQLLTLKLVANNFESVEKLQTELIKAKVKVKQTEALMHENKVVATLELSL